MGKVNRAMFKSINLHATEDKLQQLVQTALAPIRPFVRQLNFFPSPYIPGLSREEFEGILRIHYSGAYFSTRLVRSILAPAESRQAQNNHNQQGTFSCPLPTGCHAP
jgi:hypothetical protein